jgi:hypothetical protein
VLHADKLFSVQTMPIWQLCLIAAAAVTFMVSVLYWMMPPPLRRSRTAVSPALATLLLVAWVTTSHDPRAVLWFTAVCSAVVALPLLWMGPLPQDMPSARDPACRHHPQYERVAHRGRIAGSIMVIAIVASVALSMAFVDGL